MPQLAWLPLFLPLSRLLSDLAMKSKSEMHRPWRNVSWPPTAYRMKNRVLKWPVWPAPQQSVASSVTCLHLTSVKRGPNVFIHSAGLSYQAGYSSAQKPHHFHPWLSIHAGVSCSCPFPHVSRHFYSFCFPLSPYWRDNFHFLVTKHS